MAQLEKQRLSEPQLVTPVEGQLRTFDFPAPAQNDNEINDISDEKVLKAARLLMARHTPQAPVELSAFDKPHNALADISEKLEELGISHAVSEPLMQSLKGYVLEKGGSFARAANAKPISVYMVVSDTLPPRRFDNGVTEVAYIGRKVAKVEGASSINVRLTVSGTAMTSNAADVDRMFANVNETGLWLRFEAPTKEDLDGLMTVMESGLASAVQAVGGAMDASDLKKLLETLQKDDALLPQVENLIVNLIALQEALGGKGEIPATEIPKLVEEIASAMSNPDYVDLIPPSFMQAAINTMQSLSVHAGMPDILAENGFGHLVESEQEHQQSLVIENALEALGEVLEADNLNPEIAKSVSDLIADIKASIEVGEAPNTEILTALQTGIENVAPMEALPPEIAAILEGVNSEIKAVMPEVPSEMGFTTDLSKQADALLDIITEVAAKIESGELSKEDLPEGTAELFDKIAELKTTEKEIGREAMQAEIIKVLEGKADTDFSIKVESVVLMLSKPDMQGALPADLSNSLQGFVREYPMVIETVATNHVVRDITEKIKLMPTGSPEAEQLKSVIETIKVDGLGAAVLSTEAQVALPLSVQVFIRENPSIVESVAAQAIVRDLVEQFKAVPAGAPEAEQIKSVIETIKADGLGAAVLSTEGKMALPPSVQAFIKENPSIIEAVATQSMVRDLAEQMKAAPAGSPEAEQIKAVIETIKADGLGAAVLSVEAQVALPASVQAFIKENPSIIEAVATQAVVRDLLEQVKAVPAGSPEAEQLKAVIDTIKADGLGPPVLFAEAQIALPQSVQAFIKENPSIIEAVATQVVVRDLVEQIKAVQLGSPESEQLKAAIETIKADGLSGFISSAEVMNTLSPSVQIILKDHPIAAEAALTNVTVRELTAHVQTLPANSAEARQVQDILQAIKKDSLSALLSSKDGLSNLPPNIQSFIKQNPDILLSIAGNAALRGVPTSLNTVSSIQSENKKSSEPKHVGKNYTTDENNTLKSDKNSGSLAIAQRLAEIAAANTIKPSPVVGVEQTPPKPKQAESPVSDAKPKQPENQKQTMSVTTANTSGYSYSSQSGGAGPSGSGASYAGLSTSGAASPSAGVSGGNSAATGAVTSAQTSSQSNAQKQEFSKGGAAENTKNPAQSPANPACGKTACDCNKHFNGASAKGALGGTTATTEKINQYQKDGNEIVYKNPEGATVRLTQEQAVRQISSEIKTHHNFSEDKFNDIVAKHGGNVLEARAYVIQQMDSYTASRAEASAMAQVTTSTSDLQAGLASFGTEKKSGGLCNHFGGCACAGSSANPAASGISIPNGSSLDSLGALLGGGDKALSGEGSGSSLNIDKVAEDKNAKQMNASFGFDDFTM